MRRREGEPAAVTPAVLLVAPASPVIASALEPAGPAAERIAALWWWMFWLGTVIWVVVVGLLVVALRRRGVASSSSRVLPVVLGGVVLPAVVLPVVYVLNLDTLLGLPRDGNDALRIEVTGNQYWWEVEYPELGIVTANEFNIPVGRPVQLTLRSDDVIHSFWVPQLHGKLDLVPGKVNTLTVVADEPGIFHGQCAEYCGLQHAKMLLSVTAQPPAEFRQWAEVMSQPASEPRTALLRAGRQAFFDSGCAACHSIAGTPADGDVAPDLTHFGLRRSIGAGAAPNEPGFLGGWIVNSQSLKPGNHMPPMPVDADALPALIAYLESLQ